MKSRNRRNAVAGALKLLIPTLASIASTAVLYRLAGPSAFGLFSLAIAFAGLGDLVQVGAAPAVVRLVAYVRRDEQGPETMAEIAGAGMVFGFASAAVLLLTVGTIVVLKPGFLGIVDDQWELAAPLFLWAAATAVARFLYGPLLGLFEGLERYDVTARALGSRAVIAAFADMGLLVFTGSLVAVLVGRLVTQLWVLARSASLLRNEGYLPRFSNLQVNLKRIVSFASEGSAAAAFSLGLRRGLYFIIAYYLGASWTGFYSLLNELATKVHMLMAGFFEFIFPVASRCKAAGNMDEVVRVTESALRYGLLLFLPLTAAGVLLFSPLLALFVAPTLPEAFSPNGIPLVFAGITVPYFVYGLSSIEWHIANGFDRPDANRNLNGLVCAGVLITGLYLVPEQGIWGALIAMQWLTVAAAGYVLYGRTRLLRRRPIGPGAATTVLGTAATLVAVFLAFGMFRNPLVLPAGAVLVLLVAELSSSRFEHMSLVGLLRTATVGVGRLAR